MMGYDITWAAFNMIEVMSSTKFTFKVQCLIQLQSLRTVMFIVYVLYLYNIMLSTFCDENCRNSALSSEYSSMVELAV